MNEKYNFLLSTFWNEDMKLERFVQLKVRFLKYSVTVLFHFVNNLSQVKLY
jgi:hypothetical protein